MEYLRYPGCLAFSLHWAHLSKQYRPWFSISRQSPVESRPYASGRHRKCPSSVFPQQAAPKRHQQHREPTAGQSAQFQRQLDARRGWTRSDQHHDRKERKWQPISHLQELPLYTLQGVVRSASKHRPLERRTDSYLPSRQGDGGGLCPAQVWDDGHSGEGWLRDVGEKAAGAGHVRVKGGNEGEDCNPKQGTPQFDQSINYWVWSNHLFRECCFSQAERCFERYLGMLTARYSNCIDFIFRINFHVF